MTLVAGQGLAAGAPAPAVLPAFHMAPAALEEPGDADVGGTNVSAHGAPRAFRVEPAQAALGTARLTPQALAAHLRARALSATPSTGSGTVMAVYSPAQIRAAYSLPDLPAVGATLSAEMAAGLGAGQTIYILDAQHAPNALADLNRFSAKFGLPGCAAATVSAVPLAAAGASCAFSQVYTDAGAALKSTAPAYDEGWATEISLDVQWAHAIAPLARVVLIEVPSTNSNDLLGGVALANKMGPGVVSMSFGAAEGNWMPGTASAFNGAGMTYVAAAGDNGNGVEWPAALAQVVAVGGTHLGWGGVGPRSETVWSGTGGGVSAWIARPAWQSAIALSSGAPSHRAVVDVAFNADPASGQYVAITPPGSGTTSWNAYGGTSISAPQWAGLFAVINARRALQHLGPIGDPHAALYTAIGAVPGNQAAAFLDITQGSDGSCATCRAGAGYDLPSGWGTPNAGALASLLVGSAPKAVAAPVAPVVPGGSFSARAQLEFSQPWGGVAPSGVTTSFSLTGAPTGLGVSAAGVLSWASPVAGTYAVTLTATTSAGASASGRYTLTFTADRPPRLQAASYAATTGVPFNAAMQGSDPDGDPLVYSVSGAPAGLSVSAAGLMSWPKPVAGVHALRVTARDPFGQTATATITVSVSSATGHVLLVRGASVQ